MKNKKFKLDIQFFAEGGDGGNAGAQATQTNTSTIDYTKIEEIVNKRSQTSADSVLKGILKEQGLTGDELNQAVADYKNKKAEEKKTAKQEQDRIKLENEQLKAQILNSNIDSKLTALATTEGVKAEKIPFLLKLAERTNLSNDKGEIDDAKCKEAIDNVLKAFPDFKNNVQANNGFQQIGGNGSNNNTNTVDARLDAIFGIKKK